MTRTIHDNVGALDTVVRFLLAIGLLAGAALVWGLAPPDYVLIGFMMLPPAAYLLMTGIVHVDLLYAMLGLDTVSGHVHRVRLTPRARRHA